MAVKLTIQRELNFDGSVTVTQTVEVTKKTTYAQDWPAYNAAQTHEKETFQRLLADLCSGIPQPEQSGRNSGRKRVSLADIVQ